MDGTTTIALATLGPAVIAMGIARWKQNNKISKSIGRLQGQMETLTTAVNSRLALTEKRTDRLDERLDEHFRDHAME